MKILISYFIGQFMNQRLSLAKNQNKLYKADLQLKILNGQIIKKKIFHEKLLVKEIPIYKWGWFQNLAET